MLMTPFRLIDLRVRKSAGTCGVLLLCLAGCYGPPSPGLHSPAQTARDVQKVATAGLPVWSLAKRAHWKPSDFFDSAHEIEICEAISAADAKMLVSLAESGAELTHSGKYGVTLLHWALFTDNIDAFELLLQHGADPDRKLNEEFENARMYAYLASGESVLFTSLKMERERFFMVALQYSRNFRQTDGDGANLLHKYVVSEFACEETLQSLIDGGVDLNARTLYGSTPCHLALDRDGAQFCLQLLQAGADPSLQNDQGQDVAARVEARRAMLQKFGRSVKDFDPLWKWLRENYPGLRRRNP